MSAAHPAATVTLNQHLVSPFVVTAPTSRGRYAIRDTVAAMDPVTQHQQIGYLSACYDFPWDTTRALEFALFRSFGVAKSAKLLVKTGEFVQRTQKRYDDTVLMISEMLEHGYDSERGRTALRRMNQQHGRYTIPNDEFLYTLSTFIYEPIRWNERYGWRPLVESERLAAYYFWKRVGEMMAIKDIPDTYAAFEQYNRDYEREHFVYSDNNRVLAEVTRDFMIVRYVPRRFKHIGEPFIYAMLDDLLADAVGFPHGQPSVRALVEGALRTRSAALRWLPRRGTPRLMTQQRYPSYPNGYRVEELGAGD
jgi:hypothetical protein